MLTFGEAKSSSELRKVSGFCPDSDDYRHLVNECARKYGRRGDFQSTIKPIYVCARAGCVVFPRYVRSVRKMNVCGHRLDIKNGWYHFLGSDHCFGTDYS